MREHQDNITRQHRVSKHIELGSMRIIRDETDVYMIQNCIISWIPDLWAPTQPMVNFATGQQASPEIIENFKTIQLRGAEAFQEFLSRFTSKSNSTNEQSNKTYYDPIRRQTLVTFESNGSKTKAKSVTKDEKQSFTFII